MQIDRGKIDWKDDNRVPMRDVIFYGATGFSVTSIAVCPDGFKASLLSIGVKSKQNIERSK